MFIKDLNFYLTRIRPWLCSLQKYVYFIKDLSQPETIVEPKIPITLNYLLTFPADNVNWGAYRIKEIRGQSGLRQFAKRWSRGDLLTTAWVSDILAAFIWFRIYPPSYRSREGRWGHAYDAWTFEQYRGNRLMPALQQAVFRYCREERTEISHIDTYVSIENIPSLKGDLRAGYTASKIQHHIRFLGIELQIRSNKDISTVVDVLDS